MSKAKEFPVSPSKYYDLLEQHDWYYMMSDDSSKFNKGLDNARYLEAIASADEALRTLYFEYHQHVWSGNAYGTVKAPKPARPAEEQGAA